MATFMGRILRAAKLDMNLYEEVEADTGGTPQAMAVVVLGSVAAGIGAGGGGLGAMLMVVVAALIGWLWVRPSPTYHVGLPRMWVYRILYSSAGGTNTSRRKKVASS